MLSRAYYTTFQGSQSKIICREAAGMYYSRKHKCTPNQQIDNVAYAAWQWICHNAQSYCIVVIRISFPMMSLCLVLYLRHEEGV